MSAGLLRILPGRQDTKERPLPTAIIHWGEDSPNPSRRFAPNNIPKNGSACLRQAPIQPPPRRGRPQGHAASASLPAGAAAASMSCDISLTLRYAPAGAFAASRLKYSPVPLPERTKSGVFVLFGHDDVPVTNVFPAFRTFRLQLSSASEDLSPVETRLCRRCCSCCGRSWSGRSSRRSGRRGRA